MQGLGTRLNPIPNPNTNPNPTPIPNPNPNLKLTTQLTLIHNSLYPRTTRRTALNTNRKSNAAAFATAQFVQKNFIQSKTNRMKFPIINNSKLLTCNTAGIVYCIECTKYGKQNVRQTLRKLKNWLSQHLVPQHNPDQVLKKHYFWTPKYTLGNIRFQILDTKDWKNNSKTPTCQNQMDPKPSNHTITWPQSNWKR